MYSKQTVYDAHLTSKKHIKAAQKQATAGAPPANPNGPPTASGSHQTEPHVSGKDKHRNAALLTHLCTALLRALSPALNDTKSNVERRFSLTAREREQELLEQSKKPPPANKTPANGEGAEEEEEEERIYNPLKLPLGWDGKPIPYWLYKLHGLGVEYRCEICSDHVYMGRKNFERHFQVCICTWRIFLHLAEVCCVGIEACVWYACTWPTEHEAFPRDHQDRGCAST